MFSYIHMKHIHSLSMDFLLFFFFLHFKVLWKLDMLKHSLQKLQNADFSKTTEQQPSMKVQNMKTHFKEDQPWQKQRRQHQRCPLAAWKNNNQTRTANTQMTHIQVQNWKKNICPLYIHC